MNCIVTRLLHASCQKGVTTISRNGLISEVETNWACEGC